MIPLNFKVKLYGKTKDISFSLPEIQSGFICTSNIRPDWLIPTGIQGILSSEEGQSTTEFLNDCNIILSKNKGEEDAFGLELSKGLILRINLHIQQFNRLLFRDLLLYIDCYCHLLHNTVLTLAYTQKAYSSILSYLATKYMSYIYDQTPFGLIKFSDTDMFQEVIKRAEESDILYVRENYIYLNRL